MRMLLVRTRLEALNITDNMKQKQIRYCKNCNKPLLNRGKSFCSNSCQQDYLYKKYIDDWKQNKVNGLSGKYSISNYIRKYLFIKYNYKCCICGWGVKNLFTNKIPLEIHHIDGDYTNNNESNLQLLCPNCHSLTSTYKNLNKVGRKQRKQYSN